MALVAVAALIPLVFNPRFYFYADTQDGAYGIWYEIGRSLLAGEWPFFSLDGWMAGNHVAEGQWGLWNPVIMAIGIFVYLIPNGVVAATIIKVAFLSFAAGGTYLMARSYGSRVDWAFIAALAAPLAGFTLFMDAASWVTNLFVWAFFPWVLWGLRRMVWQGGSPIHPLVSGFLLVTIGYVHGTVMLVILYLALLAEIGIRRAWRRMVPLLVVGVVHGLVAVTVYLPGVLTAPVTARATGIANDGFMVATLSGLVSSVIPSAHPDLLGWWGRYADTPLLYIAWFLPILAFIDYRRMASLARAEASLFILFVASLAFILGPSRLGPLQFPVRIMPWVAITAIVIVAVAVSRALPQSLTRGRLLWALGISAGSLWLAASQFPSWWRIHLVSGLAIMVGVTMLWLALREGRGASIPESPSTAMARFRRAVQWKPFAVVVVTAVSLGVLTVQAKAFATVLSSVIPAPELEDDYQSALKDAKGEAFVVGSPYFSGPGVLDESLLSNSWYLNRTPTHNLYTPVQYLNYARDMCLNHAGLACDDAEETLFSLDDTTGERVVDLLSIDTVQLLKTEDESVADLADDQVPSGWSRVAEGEDSVTWVRDDEPDEPGAVVWMSDGTRVTMISNSDAEARFRVDAVGPGGGTVALSRLAWPGYSVEGGEQGERLRGYLLTVEVSPDSAGETVTVSFAPPAWPIALAAMVLAVVLALGMVLLDVRHRRRRADQSQAVIS